MPQYVYKCINCGEMEITQKMQDLPLKMCPKCKRLEFRRVIKRPTIIYKGSGFYTTDGNK